MLQTCISAQKDVMNKQGCRMPYMFEVPSSPKISCCSRSICTFYSYVPDFYVIIAHLLLFSVSNVINTFGLMSDSRN